MGISNICVNESFFESFIPQHINPPRHRAGRAPSIIYVIVLITEPLPKLVQLGYLGPNRDHIYNCTKHAARVMHYSHLGNSRVNAT